MGSPDSWSGAAAAPIEAKAAFASAVLRHALSGGNSTIRKIVPVSGGSSLIFPAAASLFPLFEAGAVLVRHRSVKATPGIDFISRMFGALPSAMNIDLPSLSCPVTTRRMRWAIRISSGNLEHGRARELAIETLRAVVGMDLGIRRRAPRTHEQSRGRRDGRHHRAPDHGIEVERLQQHLDRHFVGKVVLGELHDAVAVRRIVPLAEPGVGVAAEADGFEGIEGVLGLDLGGPIEERAENRSAAWLFEPPVAQEIAVEMLVVPDLVGADLGREALQHRLAAQFRQHAVEG